MTFRHVGCWLTVVGTCLLMAHDAAAAPVVWTGPTIAFSKGSFADPSLPENQDHLTANVAFTRGSTQGLYNPLAELGFSAGSPADTEWATDLNNEVGATIAATNHGALQFEPWVAAYDNAIGLNIVGRDAVIHLISDDVYLDIHFSAWGGSTSGGSFTYERTTPVPEPGAMLLVLAGLLILAGCRRVRDRG